MILVARTNAAGDKAFKVGTLVAHVQMLGSTACLSPSGANIFTLVGVHVGSPGELSWNDLTDPIDPKGDGSTSLTNPWGDKK